VESASNFDPTPIVLQVFGTVGESAVFGESDRRPSVTPPFSSKTIVDQAFALMSSGVTVRRLFTLAIGAAFMHQDGDGYNIVLQALPIDGKIVLRLPKDDQGQQPSKEANVSSIKSGSRRR
jgi:hypothetical protein